MNMNLKMFCGFCFIWYCIILCNTSKRSENLTFVLKQSHSVEWFCCHHYLLSGQEDQRVCRTNDIIFISKSYCAWGSKYNFDPEIDLDDDAFGRSRYEWFWSVRSSYARKTKPSKTFARVLKELSHVFKQSRKLRQLTQEHIPKNILKSSKIHYYTRRAHVLCDVM